MSQAREHEPDDEALARALEEADRRAREGESGADGLAQQFEIDAAAADALVNGLDAFEQALLGDDVSLEFSPPELPEDFEVLAEIGRGGMGVVYRARQRSLERDVAVKVLRPGALHFSGALDRFRLEARSLGKLRHRHIVAIHEIGEVGGDLFFSMDLIEGGSLAQRLKDGPLGSAQSVRLMRQVTSAMVYTHGAGLVHRDLKPANVLLDPEGDAYVVDFGLARDISWDGGLTSTGHLLGTPDFMSPEQARGDRVRVGEASDIYGLGAILYACLTGVAPFDALPLADKIHRVVYDLPPAPSKRNPRVPRDLETICSKAMAKRPEDRYVTARALLEDLERFEQGRSILARRPTPGQLLRRTAARHARELLVAGAVALLAGAFLWLMLADQRDRDLTRRLDNVRTLLDAGEGRAAAMMMDETTELAEGRDLKRPEDLALAHLRARCDLVRASELKGRGLVDEARDAFERAESTLSASAARARYSRVSGYPPIRFELLADLAIAQVELGQSDDALDTLARFEGGLVHASQTDRLLGWMAPRVADPSDTGHAAGALIVAHALDWSTPGAFGTWLARRPELATDIVEAMLVSLDTLPPDRAKLVRLGLLRRNVLSSPALGIVRGRQEGRFVTLANRIEERLATIAVDPSRADDLRGLATGVLVQLADLPFRLPGDPLEASFDSSAVEQVLEGWEQTRKAPDRREALADWLRAGLSGLSEAARADAEHWHQLWFDAALSPGLRSVPLLDEGEARTQLELMHTLGEPQARQLQRALERLAPAGSEAPHWPSWGKSAPAEVRQLAWRAALGPLGKDYRLSIAHFIYLEGDDRPQLGWRRQHDLAYGDRIAMRVVKEDLHPVTRNRRSHDWMGVRSPALRRARPGTFVLELDGTLELDGAGLFFDIDRLEYDLAVGGPKDGWSVRRAGETLLAGRVAALAIQEYGWPRHGTHTGLELVLGVIDPIGEAEEFDSSSIEAWRERLATEVQRDGNGLLTVAGDATQDQDGSVDLDPAETWVAELPRNLRVAITNQWILAGILAIPEQLEILRASAAALRACGAFSALLDADASFPVCYEPGSSFERTIVQLGAARIAAGDVSALDEEDLLPMLEESSLTRTQWGHRVLDMPEGVLRDFALARLDSKFTPDGLWQTLGRRANEEGVQLPDWALERVAQAPANLRSEERRLAGKRVWVNGFHLVISLFMLWMLLSGNLSVYDRIGLGVCALLLAFTQVENTLHVGPVIVVMAPISVLLAWLSVNALWSAVRSASVAPPGPRAGRGTRLGRVGFALALVSSLAVMFGAGDPARWFMRLGLLLVVAELPALLSAMISAAGVRGARVVPWLSRGVWFAFLPIGGSVLLSSVWGSLYSAAPLALLAEWAGLDLRSVERTLDWLVYGPAWALLGAMMVAGLAWSNHERERLKLEQAQLEASS